MTSLRAHLVFVLLPGVLLGTTACTDGTATSAAPASTSPAGSPSGTTGAEPAPTPAGASEAAVLAQLPPGTATGTAVLQYDGIGELSEPFRGQCSSTADVTTISGTADTARIELTATSDGLQVALEDIGLSATSQLSTGRYEVTAGHLSLDAPLSSDGEAVGSAKLEIDCGG